MLAFRIKRVASQYSPENFQRRYATILVFQTLLRSQRAFLLSTTKSFWNLVMSGLSVTLIPGTVSVMIQWELEEIVNNAIALWTFWKWPQHLPSVVASVAECSSSRVFKYLGITLVLSLDYPQMDLTGHANYKLKKPYEYFSNAIEV